MAQVFISYSRKDEAFAQQLAAALIEQKREVWLDRKDIEFTADWKQRVLRGIEGANAFICVVSPDYAASAVCREEAGHAVAHNKRLVPLLRRPVDFGALHPAIAAINVLPFAESDDFAAGVDKLVKALDTDFEWLDWHTRLLRRALEWDGKARDLSLILRGNDLRAAEQWLTQAGSARERNPTQLQTEYILTSRRASNRRLRMFLGIAIAVVVVTIVLAAVAMIQRGVARTERSRAEQRTREVSQSLSRSDFLEATRRLAANEAGAAIAHLARALRVDPENRIAQQRLISLLSQRAWQFPALDPLVHSDFVWSAEFSPDGKRIATSFGGGAVQLWNAENGERIGEPLSYPALATIGFSRDGSKIAVSCELDPSEKSVRGRWQILDGVTGRPLTEAKERAGEIAAAGFTSDGERLLIGWRLGNGAGEVCAYDAAGVGTPQTLLSFKDAAPVAFDAAGARVITLSREPNAAAEGKPRIARVWNLHTGKPTTRPFKHDDDIHSAIFSPDGDHIATWSWLGGRASVWDLAADRLAFATHPIAENLVLPRIAYSPDAKLLVKVAVEHPTQEVDWVAQIYNAITGEPVGEEIRDHGVFSSVAFSPDSRFLLLCSSGKRARVWPVEPRAGITTNEAVAPLEHAETVTVARMSPNGQRIATGSMDRTLRLWQATPGLGCALPEKLPTAQPVFFMEVSSRGARLATVSWEPSGAQIWDMATRQPVTAFLPHAQTIHCARFSGDERRLMTGGENGQACVWDASDGRLITQLKHPSGAQINAVALNVDGSRAVSATSSEVLLWDIATGRAIPLPIKTAEFAIPEFEFVPDGTRLLTISDKQLHAWNAATGERAWGPVTVQGSAVRFSAEGGHFSVIAAGVPIRHFETATGKLEPSAPYEMESSADRLVATQGGRIRQAGYVQVWDAVSGAAVTPQLWGEDEVQGVCLSPDGTLVCALERGGLVRIWSTATGRECIDPLPHMPAAFPIWFSGDGKRILTVNDGVPQFHELWGFGGRAPDWLPNLAEAIGGLTLNDSGVTVPLDRRLHALDEIRKAIAGASGDDLYLKWARWFFADRRTRNISPFSQRTMREELAQKP